MDDPIDVGMEREDLGLMMFTPSRVGDNFNVEVFSFLKQTYFFFCFPGAERHARGKSMDSVNSSPPSACFSPYALDSV